MAVAIYESEKNVTSVELDELETRLHVKLPENYRAFLMMHNGGRPEPGSFSFVEGKSGRTESSVAWFFAVHPGRSESFEVNYRIFKILSMRIPLNLIPIAGDPFGNLICMSFGGDDAGFIYFWDHEKERRKPDYKNCYLIAKSLEQFLDELHD